MPTVGANSTQIKDKAKDYLVKMLAQSLGKVAGKQCTRLMGINCLHPLQDNFLTQPPFCRTLPSKQPCSLFTAANCNIYQAEYILLFPTVQPQEGTPGNVKVFAGQERRPLAEDCRES